MSLRWDEQLFLGMYQLGMNVFFPPALLALSPLLLFKKKRRTTLFARLGFQRFRAPSSSKGGTTQGSERALWVHALSQSGSAFRPSFDQGTPQANQAGKTLPLRVHSERIRDSEREAGRVFGRFSLFPAGSPFAVRRCFASLKPAMVVLVETDIWPGFMAELRRQSIPSFLINARLSSASFKRYDHAKRLFSPALNTFSRVYPQSVSDSESFRKLGVNPEKLADPGNLKFDAAKTSSPPAQKEELRVKLAIQEGRAFWWPEHP